MEKTKIPDDEINTYERKVILDLTTGVFLYLMKVLKIIVIGKTIEMVRATIMMKRFLIVVGFVVFVNVIMFHSFRYFPSKCNDFYNEITDFSTRKTMKSLYRKL